MSKINSHQIDHLVNFMTNYPLLRKGKLNNDFTLKKKQELWKQLTQELNSIGGCEKTVEKWQKTWIDMKSNVRKKASRIKLSSSLTGGGKASKETLSMIEEKILGIVGIETISGINDAFDIKEGDLDIPNKENEKTIREIDHDYHLVHDINEVCNTETIISNTNSFLQDLSASPNLRKKRGFNDDNTEETFIPSSSNNNSFLQDLSDLPNLRKKTAFNNAQQLKNSFPSDSNATTPVAKRKRGAYYIETGRSKDILEVQTKSTNALEKIAEVLKQKNELFSQRLDIKKKKIEAFENIERRKTEAFENIAQALSSIARRLNEN